MCLIRVRLSWAESIGQASGWNAAALVGMKSTVHCPGLDLRSESQAQVCRFCREPLTDGHYLIHPLFGPLRQW